MPPRARLDALLALQADADADDVDRELLSAPAAETQQLTGTANAVLRVTLENGRQGYFKPLGGVSEQISHDYGHSPIGTLLNECAAWHAAKALGPNYEQLVPPCVWRTFDTIPDGPGSFSLRAPGELFKIAHPDGPTVATASLYDAIIGNQDRHLGNFLWDEDNRHLTLIDHGFAFPHPGATFHTSHFHEFRHTWAPHLYRTELDTLTLAPNRLRPIEPIIGPLRTDALQHRIAIMHATALITEPGHYGPTRRRWRRSPAPTMTTPSITPVPRTTSDRTDRTPGYRPSR